MRKKSTLTFVLVLVLAFVAVGGYVVVADEADAPETVCDESDAQETVSEKSAQPVSTEERAHLAGMTVSIDPDSGALRAPTAEEAAAFSAALQRMFATSRAAAPAAVTHANGMVSVRLGFEHMDFSVAHRGDDGELHFNCVDDHKDAIQLIETQTAQPAWE